MIKILSIDDHRLFFDGLKSIIESEPDLLLVDGFPHISNLEASLDSEKPDIVLLDMYLGAVSGITIAAYLKSNFPQVKVIILSSEVNLIFANQLKEIGVEAYVSKECDASELIDILRKVAAGDIVYKDCTAVPKNVLNVLQENYGFTERELEIYEHVKNGKSSVEIAEILHRSVLTVTTHRKNIKQKLKSHFKT